MESDPEVSLPVGLIRSIGGSADRDEIVGVAAHWLQRTTGADWSGVALPADLRSITVQAVGGSDRVLPVGFELPIPGSMTGSVLRAGRMAVVDDIGGTGYSEQGHLADAGLRSLCVAPIVSGSRCLGTVAAASAEPGFFTAERRGLIGAVADLLSGSLSLIQLAERERRQAETDVLTGALSRGAVMAHLEDQFEGCAGRPSILYLDLDGFKLINDVHGHQAGDRVLRSMANRIMTALGPGERLGRLGGDEFLIVVTGDESGDRAHDLARAVVRKCDDPIVIGPLRIKPRVSIGVASSNRADIGSAGLLAEADEAMYQAKGSDRRVVLVDGAIRGRTAMLAAVDRDFERAVTDGTLRFAYQPVCWLENGEVAGVEALVRWCHPLYGPITAALLVDRIEATGQVALFTRWCFETAVRDLRTIREAVPSFEGKRIGVNLSPRQLALPDCAPMLLRACRIGHVDPADFLIELVESSEIEEGGLAEKALSTLSDSGSTIALDDFGTGRRPPDE